MKLDKDKKYFWICIEGSEVSMYYFCGKYKAVSLNCLGKVWGNLISAQAILFFDTKEEAKTMEKFILTAPIEEVRKKLDELYKEGKVIPRNSFEKYLDKVGMEVDFEKKVIRWKPKREDMVCDFCCSHDVKWIHEATDCKFPDPPPMKSIGAWAACNACHNLIEGCQRKELLDRSEEAYKRIYPVEEVDISLLRKILNNTHETFWQNRTGRYEKF